MADDRTSAGNNYLRKFLFDDIPVTGSIVRLGEAWDEILASAQPHPSCRKLLAEALCAAALLSSNIKFRGAVSLQIQSSQFLRLLLAQCTHEGRLRGIARVKSADELSVLERSVLSINLEPDSGGVPYQGIVEMNEMGLVSALEKYFMHSEQLQTRFWLAEKNGLCGGLMLQRLPDALLDDETWNRVQAQAATIRAADLTDDECELFLRRLFPEDNVRLFKPAPLKFGCSCSPAKVSGMLIALGRDELTDLLQTRDAVEVRCEYCGRDYRFDSLEITNLFTEASGLSPTSTSVH